MNPTALRLPARAAKPRRAGLTMVIDGGIPTAHFADLVSSAAEYIDFVKFGWGTAVVTSQLGAKIEVLAANDVGFYFGGTLFEKYVLQGRFDDFRKFCGIARTHRVASLDIFLTAPGRQSSNAGALVEALERAAKHPVRVLTKEEFRDLLAFLQSLR